MKTALGWMAAALCASATAETLFQENFQYYGNDVPGMHKDMGTFIFSEECWQWRTYLDVTPPKDGLLYAKAIPLAKDGDFLFRYNFHNSMPPDAKKNAPGKPGAFSLVFTAPGKSKSVRIAANDVAGFPVAFADNMQWLELAVKFSGAKASVHYAPRRLYGKLGEIDLGFVPTAVNFALEKGSAISLVDLVSRTAEPLPDRRCGSAEGIYPSFASLQQPIAGARTASGGEVVDLTPPASGRVVLRFAPGNATNELSKFVFGKREAPIAVAPSPDKGWHGAALPDAVLKLGSGYTASTFFVRPSFDPWRAGRDNYGDDQTDVIRDWDDLPSASAHPFSFAFERTRRGVDFYVDGSYAATLSEADAAKIVFKPAKGVPYAVETRLAGVDSARFMPVDLASHPRAKAFAEATLGGGLRPGLADFGGVPIAVAKPLDSLDAGLVRRGHGMTGIDEDRYTRRSAWCGNPGDQMFRLPAAQYARAHVLFALDPDPKKEKVVTIRLRDAGCDGANMMADTKLDFTAGVPASARKVGEVAKNGVTCPVYLCAVDLNLGPIFDLTLNKHNTTGPQPLAGGPHGALYLEFLCRGWRNVHQLDYSFLPDPQAKSAFNFFGVTLETPPVEMDFVHAQVGNVFCDGETNRVTGMTLVATRKDARGTLVWTARDAGGRELFKGEQAFALAAVGDTQTATVDLSSIGKRGFYTLVYELKDAQGRKWFDHEARFALLPPMKRDVPREDCPYATWWWGGVHGTTAAEHVRLAPLLQKIGFRRAGMDKQTFDAYDLRPKGCIYAPGEDFVDYKTGKVRDGEKGEENFRRDIQKKIDELGGFKPAHLMVWHESGPGGGIPEEVLGLPVPEATEMEKRKAIYINEIGRLMRKYFPDVKIQIGNSVCSIGSVFHPMRGGANPDYYDFIGIENPTQTVIPERLTESGFIGKRVGEDVGAYYAGHKVRSNGCYEFIYRTEANLGVEQCAAWYMRDMLVALMADNPLVSPSGINDVRSCYYNTYWGQNEMTVRAPLSYPKLMLPAFAAITWVMDGVKFSRRFDVGSSTVYAVEFKRFDGRYATALWCSRGEAELTVDACGAVPFFSQVFGRDAGAVVDMFGNETPLAIGESVVTAGEKPVYLVTDRPLCAVAAKGARTFARDMRITADADVHPLPRAADCTLEPDPDVASANHNTLPILVAGRFALKDAADASGNPVLELSLDRSFTPPLFGHVVSNLSPYVTEYTTIRFKEPIALAGDPAVIGAEVEGDSNWGQIQFEVVDAKGEVFRNLPNTIGCWGCNILDWTGHLCVNFDGWGRCWSPVRETPLVEDRNPGVPEMQWVSSGGDKTMDFPVKVRAITVGVNRTKFDLSDFLPSAGVIRLRGVFGAAKTR